MFFSEYYGIDSSVVEHYGAVDISWRIKQDEVGEKMF